MARTQARVCSDCATDFVGARSRCNDCHNAWRRARRRELAEPKSCIECGRPIEFGTGQVLCSDECRVVARRRERGVVAGSTRTCQACGVEFTAVSGRQYNCTAECADRAKHDRYKADPVMVAKRRAYMDGYYERNRERINAVSANWRERNRDRHRELSLKWARENKLRISAGRPSWRQRNPERHAAKQRMRSKRVAELTPYEFEHDKVVERLAFWGDKCWMCGGTANSVDHVKPLAAGGLNIPANLRPACKTCNSRKGAKWFGPKQIARFVRASSHTNGD